MSFWTRLRSLFEGKEFRRLLQVRIFSQAGDGTVQLAIASYVLFSPQSQTSAWAILGVLAVTLLPFTIVGPFVSPLLDRWSRRQVLVICDAIRLVVAACMSILVFTGAQGATQGWLFALLLIESSINRFVMADLSAALPHVITPKQYLDASSVMPILGPLGLLLGGVIAGGLRLGTTSFLETFQADGMALACAVVFFGLSVASALRVGRWEWGPEKGDVTGVRTKDVLRGLIEAFQHLAERRPARLGVIAMGIQRTMISMLMVAMILAFRHYYNPPEAANAALVDMGLWSGLLGAGFVLGPLVAAPIADRLGIRRTVVLILALMGVFQLMPGLLPFKIATMATALLLGLAAQSMKILVDTIVQAHVDADFKGRVFIIYDMVFNVAVVLAAVLVALLLPPEGASIIGFAGIGVVYFLTAAMFFWVSAKDGNAAYDAGTTRVQPQ